MRLAIIIIYFWFGLNSALRPFTRSAMAMRTVIAITIVITMAATTPPMMATVLSEPELAESEGATAVCGGGVVVDTLFPGPTAAVKNIRRHLYLCHL